MRGPQSGTVRLETAGDQRPRSWREPGTMKLEGTIRFDGTGPMRLQTTMRLEGTRDNELEDTTRMAGAIRLEGTESPEGWRGT